METMFPMVQAKNFEIILSFFHSPLYGIMLVPPSINVKLKLHTFYHQHS